nr:hypothetical protein GCM10010200_021480 [Actinomadura rugatobispora]
MRCVTATPFGTPVDPDVYITYARSSADTRTSGPSGRGSSIKSSPVRTTDTPASATIARRRSTGCPASSGTYAAPAFNTASNATTRSADRSITTPTRSPGRTPRPTSACARPFARPSSSAYDRATSPDTTAIASGDCGTRRSNSSANDASGTGWAVSFRSIST